MATPLRKEHPEFDDEQEITTADLAQPKRPASDTRGPQVVSGTRTMEQGATTSSSLSGDTTDKSSAPLFPNSELDSLRTRWKEIQTTFVDEPRHAVEQADGLVASAMKRLAEVFADERSRLEKQ